MEFTIRPSQLNSLVKNNFIDATFIITKEGASLTLTNRLLQASVKFKPLSIQQEGNLQLGVKELKQTLKGFNQQDPIKLVKCGGIATISQGYNSKRLLISSNLTLNQGANTKPLLTISKSDLKPFIEYLRQNKNVPPVLYCLYLNNGSIVASDGCKLLVKQHTSTFDGKYLIDIGYLYPAFKLAKDALTIHISGSQVVITAGDYTIQAPLHNGTYPDYLALQLKKGECFDLQSQVLLNQAMSSKSFVIHPIGKEVLSSYVLPFLQNTRSMWIKARVQDYVMQFEVDDTTLTFGLLN